MLGGPGAFDGYCYSVRVTVANERRGRDREREREGERAVLRGRGLRHPEQPSCLDTSPRLCTWWKCLGEEPWRTGERKFHSRLE